MKAIDVINWLYSLNGFTLENTQDVLKCGDPNKQVNKVAVTMFPTVKVIKQAINWGADLLIEHEPLYFNHCDNHTDESVEKDKRALLEKSGMTVYRYHDYSHRILPDVICKGVLDKLDFNGTVDYPRFALSKITLDEPMTAVQLANYVKQKLNLNGVRVSGNLDFETCNLSFAPGCARDNYKQVDNCIFMVGETCEWEVLEYFRDASELGYKKAILVLGHVGSERDGMLYTTALLQKQFKNLTFKYLETEESFITV